MNNEISNIKYQISNKIQNPKSKIRKLFTSPPTTHHPPLSSGFTLLELLVAMSIVAILAAAIWGNFFSSITKGKDSRRKQDLESIAKSLELYYADNKVYPSAFVTPGDVFTHPGNTSVIYMPKVPGDPSSSLKYCYPTTAAGATFKLYAKLENEQDPKVIPTITCGGDYYNYGISSSNTAP